MKSEYEQYSHMYKPRNIHLLKDDGYKPYTATMIKLLAVDISYDSAKHSDYNLLTEEDLIDPSESKKPIYYEITETSY